MCTQAYEEEKRSLMNTDKLSLARTRAHTHTHTHARTHTRTHTHKHTTYTHTQACTYLLLFTVAPIARAEAHVLLLLLLLLLLFFLCCMLALLARGVSGLKACLFWGQETKSHS